MLGLLDKELVFFDSQETKIRKDLAMLDSQEAKLGVEARTTLDNAQRSHI